MKHLVAAFSLFILAATTAQAQSSVPAQPDTAAMATAPAPVGPSIQFEELKFSFGEIKAGEVVEHTFNFTNNGTLQLIISNVKTTCGCTATNFPKAPVMPGETSSITARFNSAGRRGQQNKVITVESNAIQGNTQLMLLTNIVATAR